MGIIMQRMSLKRSEVPLALAAVSMGADTGAASDLAAGTIVATQSDRSAPTAALSAGTHSAPSHTARKSAPAAALSANTRPVASHTAGIRCTRVVAIRRSSRR